MQQKKINGSGVMVFVNCQNETYILLLSSTGRGGIFFTEPGGKLECRLTVEENAIKELFEETFATIRVDDLSQSKQVLVNNKYVCFTICFRVDDLTYLKSLLNANKKTLNTANLKHLHCFTEMYGYEFLPLKFHQQQYINVKGNKIQIHRRTIGAIAELRKQQIIKEDGTLDLQEQKIQEMQHSFPNADQKLHVLNKEKYLGIL